MKKSIIYTILAGVLIFTSCSSFLDENPKSFLSPENYYKTLDDLNNGLNAVYRAPQDRYSRNWGGPCWFEWATDIMELTEKNEHAYHNQISKLYAAFNASSDVPLDFWKYSYNHLKDANNLLAALDIVDADVEAKKMIEAQARAMRAFIYFDAVRVYNGTPLLLEKNVDINFHKVVPRATPEEMYEAIIDDLKFAMATLPNKWTDASDHGRITSGAAAAMLAKVYLTMSGYPLNQTDKLALAKGILKEFVDDKKYGSHYGLLPKYEDVFESSTGPAEEGVWIVNHTRGTFDQGNRYHVEFAPLELYYAKGFGLTYGGGWSNGIPTDKFYNSYDKVKDNRFKHTFWTSTADNPEEFNALVPKDDSGNPLHIDFYRPHIRKFWEHMPNDFSEFTDLDHSIIRYADVLLMYAEVLNELGDNTCYTYINQVRARAGLDDLPVMSKEEFRNHMYLERAWELCFEGDRKFDLVRWGVYADRAKEWNPQVADNIQKGKHEFWPIPQTQRDINDNLTQNNNW